MLVKLHFSKLGCQYNSLLRMILANLRQYVLQGTIYGRVIRTTLAAQPKSMPSSFLGGKMHTYVMLRYSVMVCEVGGNSGAVGGSNNSSGASHTISPPNLGNIEIPISVQEPSKMSQKLLLPYRSRTHALFMISENLIAMSNI